MKEDKRYLALLLLEDEYEEKEEIQIIPTIDVMMFLLVFFILYTLNVIPMFRQSIVLPSTKTAQKDNIKKVFKVFVDANGNISAKGNIYGLNAIKNYIKENKNQISSILIIADKDCKLDKIMHLLDIFKEEGIANVGIASKKQ